MQIKTTMRYHYTQIRIDTIKKERISVEKDVGKLDTVHSWWEREMVQSLWKSVHQFLKILKIELPYDPAIPLLGVYLRIESRVSKRHLYAHKHSNIIHNSQMMGETPV